MFGSHKALLQAMPNFLLNGPVFLGRSAEDAIEERLREEKAARAERALEALNVEGL